MGERKVRLELFKDNTSRIKTAIKIGVGIIIFIAFLIFIILGRLPSINFDFVKVLAKQEKVPDRAFLAARSYSLQELLELSISKTGPIERDIMLRRVEVVTVKFRKKLVTNFRYIKDLLSYGLGLDLSNYVVYPDPEEHLLDGMVIRLVLKEIVVETKHQKIPYNERIVNDPDLEFGTTKVVSPGSEGVKELVYRKLYLDGKLVSTELVSEKIVKKPQDRIIHKGTKRVCKEVVVGGRKIKYYAKLRVWATSYDHTCKGCSHWTATGKYLTRGIIAVDPKVIPLHTTLYVPGYGFGQAEDTGGAIKGKKIDLAFDDIRHGTWRARYVDVYLLDHCMPEIKFNFRTKWSR